MPRNRQEELAHIEQAYATGRELVDAGMIEDALPYFDKVLVRLPRRLADQIYRMRATPASPQPECARTLPAVFRDALLAKAYCLSELGRFEDVFALLERAIALDPANPQIYAELGFAHGTQGNIAQARSAYRNAVRLAPDDPAYLCALANLALLEEKFPEVRRLARRVLKLDPASVSMLNHLAYAEYRLGNTTQAIAVLKKAVALVPGDFEILSHLVNLLCETGRLREAILSLEAHLTINEDNPEALGLMTDLLQQDGMAPELSSHVERLLKRNPNDPNAYELLAWGHFQRGDFAGAVAALRRLTRLQPMEAFHHLKLGMLYQSFGKLSPAMASLQRAYALDQGGELSRMALDAIADLDQLQVEQIIARSEADATFRRRLRYNPQFTLHQAGYLLSPAGQQLLQSFDFTDDGSPWTLPSPTIH